MARTRGSSAAPRDGRRRPTASVRRERARPEAHEDAHEDAHDHTHEEVPQDASIPVGAPLPPFPGGPVDTSLLRSYGSHVACNIWRGVDRGELKAINHFRTISELKVEQAEVRALVEASGLSTLSKCTLKMADKGLLSAFAERWHRATSSFHMPFGEMTITLDDVSSLLHLPISGALWTQPGLDREGCCMLLVELLGVTPSQAYLEMQETQGLHVRFSWLRDVYSSRIAEEAWEAAARAYLLHLVGCTIFAGKSSTYVDIVFLDLFRNLGTCSTYAWGVAALTFMYDQLGAASVAKTKQLAGYLTLMQ